MEERYLMPQTPDQVLLLPSLTATLEAVSKISTVAVSASFILGVSALSGKSLGLYGIPFSYATATDVINSALSTFPILILVFCFTAPFGSAVAARTATFAVSAILSSKKRINLFQKILNIIFWIALISVPLVKIFLTIYAQIFLLPWLSLTLSSIIFCKLTINFRNSTAFMAGIFVMAICLTFTFSLSIIQQRLIDIHDAAAAARPATICTDTCNSGFILMKMADVTIISDKETKVISIIPNSEIKRITDSRPFDAGSRSDFTHLDHWRLIKSSD